MTRAEFEQLYVREHTRAVAAAQRVCGNREIAEDAVQEAAEYILKRIDIGVGQEFTASYFIQLSTSRAKNAVDARPDRGNARVRHEVPVPDLAETEEINFRFREGVDRGQRTLRHPHAE